MYDANDAQLPVFIAQTRQFKMMKTLMTRKKILMVTMNSW